MRDPEKTLCPHRKGELNCMGHRVHPTSICNTIRVWDKWDDYCQIFFRNTELHERFPELWDSPCCHEWSWFFLRCAESVGGHLVGAFNVMIDHNDGKMVWRNFERLRFRYCPFCGQEAKPTPERLAQSWSQYQAEARGWK